MADNYKAHKLRLLNKSSRRRVRAEDNQQRKLQKELNVLLHAAEEGQDWTSLDGRFALAVARAARDSLLAEEEAVGKKIEECESLLATLQDAREDAQGRVQEAKRQVGSLLSFFRQTGGQWEWDLVDRPFETSPLLLSAPPSPSPNFSDSSDAALLSSDEEEAGNF